MLPPAATFKTILSTRNVVSLRLSAQSCLRILCPLVALIALHPIHLQAQQPTNDDEVVRVNTNLFVVPIRVKDKRGQTATPLTERDLVLKDEDHVTAGLTLYHGADRVALVFALDQSGSLRDIVSQQREAALALAERFGDKSQVAVIRFAEKPSLVVPFGRDTSAALEAFSFPAQANQHTAIFDAAAAAVKAFDGLPQIRSERRLVVLISDGLDNASTIKASSVVQAALDNHVSFYVIHLPLFEPRDGTAGSAFTSQRAFANSPRKPAANIFLSAMPSSALTPEA